jgi:hypothetical protein
MMQKDRLINGGYYQVMFMAWLGMISAKVYCIDELIKETPHPPLKVHIPFSPFNWPGLPLSASFFLLGGSCLLISTSDQPSLMPYIAPMQDRLSFIANLREA